MVSMGEEDPATEMFSPPPPRRSFLQQTGHQLPHKSKGAVRACTPSIAEELGDLGGVLTLKLQQPWLTDPCTRSAPGPTTTLALY